MELFWFCADGDGDLQCAEMAADGIPDGEGDEVAAFGEIDLLLDEELARRAAGLEREADAVERLADALAVRVECDGGEDDGGARGAVDLCG